MSTSTFPATLSYVSFSIGVFTLGLTILNLLALYSNFIATLRTAPQEVRDVLGNLRTQLLEEREALRQQAHELRARKTALREASRRMVVPPSRQHPAHRGRPRSQSRSFDNLRNMTTTTSLYSLTYAEQTLGLHYQTIRDLWRKFQALERPFLIPSDRRAEAVHRGAPWGVDDMQVVNEKGVREDVVMYSGEAPPGSSDGNYATLYQCDFAHRFVWWRSKTDVLTLADTVQRVMLRRMEREVTCVRMMVKQLRDGGDGPEDVMSPRFESGGGAGGGGNGGTESRSRTTTPMGLMRRPVGETYNVYESSDSGSDSGTRMKRRMDELDHNNSPVSRKPSFETRPGYYNNNNNNNNAGPPPLQRPPSAGQRNDSYELRYHAEMGRRQGQQMNARMMDTRGPLVPPVILQAPPQSRPKTRHGYDGSPRMQNSSFDGRR